MSGFFIQGPQTASLIASGTQYFTRPTSLTPLNAVMVTCLGSTGSTSGLIQLETTNVPDNRTSDAPTTLQRYWCPEVSCSMAPFTGSAVPCSKMMHVAFNGARYSRLRADLGPGNWEIWWHGKGNV